MSEQNAEKLKSLAEGDPELASKVRSADAAAFEALADSLGVPCTMAEFRSVLAKPQVELSEGELTQVAGGLRAFQAAGACGENNTLLSTCTKISTTTTPTGTKARLL